MLAAEGSLNKMRAVAKTHLDDAVRNGMVGLVDIQVVHFVTNKPDKARGELSSLEGIGQQCCKDISYLLNKPIASPWARDTAAVAPPAEKSALRAAEVVNQFSAEGQWTNSMAAVAAKGFTSEACVKDAKTNEIFIIKAVTAIDVKLVKLPEDIKR